MASANYYANRDSRLAYAKRWASENRERVRRNGYNHRLLKQYGLTRQNYDDLLNSQGGGCAICGVRSENATGKKMCVDHDHTTGAIRGILCDPCNNGLGRFNDDVQRMTFAIEYLQKSKVG